jgi:hypothetical protein
MLRELYDGQQFTWTAEAGEMTQAALEAAVKKEMQPILVSLAQKRASGTLTPEEQAKYEVYKVIAGLLGVRINVSTLTGATASAGDITPVPDDGSDWSLRSQDRLTASEAITAIQAALRTIRAIQEPVRAETAPAARAPSPPPARTSPPVP